MGRQVKEKEAQASNDKSKFEGKRRPRKSRGSQKNGKPFDNKGKLDTNGRDNDPNWYFTSSELAQQAAQLSFQNFLGSGAILRGAEVPTICAISVNPSPGITYFVTAANGAAIGTTNVLPASVPTAECGINMMAKKLYTLMGTFSGRVSSYAPNDVAMMILAISSVAELSEHIRRSFGVALTYNPRNRMLPLKLIRTLGFDEMDLISNLANYRMRFNVDMARINQIPLLDNIGYIRKSRDMFQRIYWDEPSNMAQIFFYKPASYWLMDETVDPNGTRLVTSRPTGIKMDDYLTLLEQMISALLNSSTLQLIYADLLNMANKLNTPTWQFDYLSENYVVMPEFNVNAILQFHNLDIVGYPTIQNDTTASNFRFTAVNDVASDANGIDVVYSPGFGRTSADNDPTHRTIVDCLSDNPTIEDRIEALRFSSIDSGYYLAISASTYTAVLPALSDHYVTGIRIYGNSATGSYMLDLGSPTIPNAVNYSYSPLTAFSNAPILYDQRSHQICGNLDYYTTVDYEYLRRVNELMTVGLFEFRA